MGGCASGVEHNETHLLPFLKRDEFALEMFTKIGLTNAEVRKFCVMFEEINTDKSGVVTSVDVLSYLDMDSDDLTIKILSPFDVENLGTLTFCEFTCALWNFLSLDTRNLPSFLFHLFDQERLFILNYSQIKLVLKMIHQQSCSDKVIVKKLLEELQDLTPITRPIFRKYCQRNPFLCQPVVALQHLMRKNVFGEIFWATLCRRRLGDTNLLEADSLFKIRDHTTKKMVNLNRSGLPPDTQDRLDGISKIREKALEKYHEQKKNITEGNNTKGLKDLGKSNSKLSNKNINKIVPINNRIREISEDPVELLSTSPPFRKITLLDLEEHAIDSDGESPSLCPTSSSIISKNSPIPVINKVVVTNSNRGTKRSGYSSISRKSKSVLKRESTYLASDSAEESESSGGSDIERVRTRRRYKKNRPKKTVRFSDINTYIYPEGTISSQNQESKLTLSPSSPSSISHTPVMEDFNLVQLTPDE